MWVDCGGMLSRWITADIADFYIAQEYVPVVHTTYRSFGSDRSGTCRDG